MQYSQLELPVDLTKSTVDSSYYLNQASLECTSRAGRFPEGGPADLQTATDVVVRLNSP